MKRFIVALALLAAPLLPAKAEEPVTFKAITSYRISSITTASASTASQAISAQTRTARIVCSVNCYVAFPVTPIVSAATVPMFLPALVPEYFKVTPGTYVQVYSDSQSGTVYVTEVGR